MEVHLSTVSACCCGPLPLRPVGLHGLRSSTMFVGQQRFPCVFPCGVYVYTVARTPSASDVYITFPREPLLRQCICAKWCTCEPTLSRRNYRMLHVKMFSAIPKCTMLSVQRATKPCIFNECTKPLSLGAYTRTRLSVNPRKAAQDVNYKGLLDDEPMLCLAANGAIILRDSFCTLASVFCRDLPHQAKMLFWWRVFVKSHWRKLICGASAYFTCTQVTCL